MLRLSSDVGGYRSVERDSQKTFEFSALKSCVKKRMRIRDEPNGGSHQTVDFSESHQRCDLVTAPAKKSVSGRQELISFRKSLRQAHLREQQSLTSICRQRQ